MGSTPYWGWATDIQGINMACYKALKVVHIMHDIMG